MKLFKLGRKAEFLSVDEACMLSSDLFQTEKRDILLGLDSEQRDLNFHKAVSLSFDRSRFQAKGP